MSMTSMTVVPIVFRFPGTLAPAANHVAILGPWNGWNPRAHVLAKDPQGFWTITLYLPPGRTIYCFNVDGAYWLDPNDDGRVPNGWGSEYSVRYVGASGPTAAFRSPEPEPDRREEWRKGKSTPV